MTLCGCVKCHESRASERAVLPVHKQIAGPGCLGWRYACEICGNKRCPHHENHAFVCTGSNAIDQIGTFASATP